MSWRYGLGVLNRLLCAMAFAGLSLPLDVLGQDYDAIKPGIVKVISVSPQGKKRTGTGFIVSVKGGSAFIVTASHVVSGDKNPSVEFFTQTGAPVFGEVYRSDPQIDIAVIAVEGDAKLLEGLRPLRLAKEARDHAADHAPGALARMSCA
jgi:S1-C subfamily serine protease